MTLNSIKPPRLFYAVWPDQGTSDRLNELQAHVHGRKTHINDFHLTLAFLGERSPDLLPTLHRILATLPPLNATFCLDRFGYFQHNKIAWIGMSAPPPALLELQHELSLTLERHDIMINDPVEFKPHITLARKADPPDPEVFAPVIWQANKIALVQSRNNAQDAKYEVLAFR